MRIAFALIAALAFAPASLAGDAEAGKSVFAKCAQCHSVGAEAKNRIGPLLNGVAGRAPAAVPEFNYSQAMKDFAAANPVWTDELLSQYLENPKAVVPGGKMAFIGLKKPEDRDNVIAYLKANP